MIEETGTLPRPDGTQIAWRRLAPGTNPGNAQAETPGVVFLSGFHSDMAGSKAAHLVGWCAERGRPFLRFDYRGHGLSGGDFQQLCLSDWLADAEVALTELTTGPQILVGSSMGGWLALLLALRQPARVAALVGIAAAPDFTETLMWDTFTPAQRATLLQDGVLFEESEYGPPLPLTLKLIEDGRQHLLLDAPIALGCPVRLLQGQADPDVPWPHALKLAEALAGTDVQTLLVKDGDHRLSRPQDLALLEQVLAALGA